MLRLILSLIFLLLCIQIIIPTTQSYEYFTNCTGSPTYKNKSIYRTNLNNLLSNLTSQSSLTGFYNTSFGKAPNRVYGLYLCRGDMNSDGCSDCIYKAHNSILQQCPTQIWAVIWYETCMLRFSNVSLFNRLDLFPYTVTYSTGLVPINKARVFADIVNKTLTELVPEVANNVIKYGTKEGNATQTLFTLGQCTPDLIPDDCDRCLRAAIYQLPTFYDARVLLPSCNIRFNVDPFYSNYVNLSFFLANSTTRRDNGPGKKSSHVAVKVSIPVIVAVLLGVAALYCVHNQMKAELSPDLDEISSVESLQFHFKEIRYATRNFSEDNKLGEGGFGAVYKGKLKNGQEIAVKRLSTDSSQGIKEFKTEVLLVAKLQHKNLVRLLGFCLHSKEKLLVYELLSKSSLDKVLLDPNKQPTLDWETRYQIISGIARGLLYLHEDSRLKVIHRDLKSSNILLDENMEAKISDFGLARLVGVDQVQTDTKRIVGTYGYMAPEYAMTGRFSVKSDAYSFGVIVLEIVSGHKCSSTTFPFDEEDLPLRAWRLWNNSSALQLVDSRIGGNFSSEEVEKCIHIALLCIEEDANKRPTMAPIVSALSGHPVALPMPTTPHLMTTNRTSSAQTSSTFSGNKDITELCPR